MRFNYSRNNLSARDQRRERFFEMVPAVVSWGILTGMIALSFVKPLWAAVIIIAFDLYWIMRLFYLNVFLVFSYVRLAIDRDIDWPARINDIDDILRDPEAVRHPHLARQINVRRRFSFRIHRRRIAELAASGSLPPPSESLYHLVIIPVAREPRDIVEPSVASLATGIFPPGRMVVIIALEGRAPDGIKAGMRELEGVYGGRFFHFAVVEHPSGIKGEARVKGSNASYAARHAADWFGKKNIPYENVIVSCFDADTVAHPDYFTCLTYSFMMTPGRQRSSFQPIPVYHNNIWDAPGFARVLDVGSSFFQMVEATNPATLVTFSSHSMSFKALVDIGYWPVDMISDDSAIFWKALIHYDGDYSVVPLYVTLSMNVALSDSWFKTLANVYKQRRRWAWGVENFPLVMRAFLECRSIPFFKKLAHGFKLFEGQIAWATWPFLLTIIGWFPAWFAAREFTHTTMYYSAPRITMTIFRLASFGLFTCIILSVLLVPRSKTKFGIPRKILHALEWLLVPLVSVVLNAVPALDAQTRLMMGKYMEFYVTSKQAKKP